MAIACNPAALVNDIPCLKCASETELDMIWLFLWSYVQGYDLSADFDTIMAMGVPYMALADRQMKEAKVALFADFLNLDSITMADMLNDMKCLPCASPKLIRAATLALICQFFNP